MMYAFCPYCSSGTLALREETVARTTRTYVYECSACLVRIELVGPEGFDPLVQLLNLASAASGGWASLSPGVSASVGPAAMNRQVAAYRSLLSWVPPADEPEPESSAPGPELRSFSGSFVGFRAWLIRNWELASTNAVATTWQPGVNEARCNLYDHHAPHDSCQCGLYALARFDDPSGWWRSADVLGAVEAWADPDEDGNHDRFFVHSTGFRAQYARVILLATDDAYPRAKNAAIRALASEHGADVCRREHLGDAAREHGQLVPDDALAWAGEGDSDLWEQIFAATTAMNQLGGVLSRPPSNPVRPWITVVPKGVKKGVKQTLGYPGGPGPGTGRWRRGDHVRDSRGVVWECVKSGKPGTWRELTPRTATI